ncbi:hypothetical protein L3Y34_002193 [Caenorhabditis briggsae]|uniref:Uncharacterized protein n=1 Tax=Caenorhabditis briggsae TaxID=6238 RepID=A0AAE9DF95_CAEBR|nr:hypothetical protein L3Y34_002193 [Caenorhabditis briggsae]
MLDTSPVQTWTKMWNGDMPILSYRNRAPLHHLPITESNLPTPDRVFPSTTFSFSLADQDDPQTNTSIEETMDQAPTEHTTSPDAVVTIPGTTPDIETRATIRDDTRRAETDTILLDETIIKQPVVY